VWLDGTGRLLALDRFQNGRTKTVVVDLERGGEMSPFLQIAEHSNDRLLLADADSGLLLVRSDAPSPGHDRLGWGVVGSTLPIRFPECLRLTDCAVTPFAIQPGQMLTPETCAVALRIDGPAGTWLGIWRPSERQVHHLPAPEGWLAGTGLWTREGVLHLPYATAAVPCGVARVAAPTGAGEGGPDRDTGQGPETSTPARPVPLQHAPLKGRVVQLNRRGVRLNTPGLQLNKPAQTPSARPAFEGEAVQVPAAHAAFDGAAVQVPAARAAFDGAAVQVPAARAAFEDETLQTGGGSRGDGGPVPPARPKPGVWERVGVLGVQSSPPPTPPQ
jgi:hypothetical protein